MKVAQLLAVTAIVSSPGWGDTPGIEEAPREAAPARASAPAALAEPTVKVVPSREGARLLIDGKLITIFRTANAGLSARERADLAAERLTRLIAGGLAPEDIAVRKLGSGWAVYASGTLLIVATAGEAALRNEAPAVTARRWATNLKTALDRPGEEREPAPTAEPADGAARPKPQPAPAAKSPVKAPVVKAPVVKAPVAKAPVVKAPVAAEKPASKPAVAPPAEPKTGPYVLRGPLDVPMLVREKRAVLTHSALSGGAAERIFDGNRHSIACAKVGAPAFWQVAFSEPRGVETVDVTFAGGGRYEWTLCAANSEADMAARKGSYRVLSAARPLLFEDTDRADFQGPLTFRVFRVEGRKLEGEGPVALAEWALWSPQEMSHLDVQAFVPNVVRGQVLQLRALGRFAAGARQNMTPEVTWEISPPSRGVVDGLSRFEGGEPGPAEIVAVFRGYRSRPLRIEVLPEGKPDWDVLYIERNPRLETDSPDAKYVVGQPVLWIAHVKNYGVSDAQPVPIEWRIDGRTVLSGTMPKVERFGRTEVVLSTKWDGQRHKIELVIDPGNEVEEVSEKNNALAVHSDALSVGFWVEESTIRYFHQHQHELGIGSNSWEDWAQRQVAQWNELLAKKGPEGTADRWRLDRIVVVGDGMLPMAPGAADSQPDQRERTVHFRWGFPADQLADRELYGRTAEKTPDNPFFFQSALFEALNRARYGRSPELQSMNRE